MPFYTYRREDGTTFEYKQKFTDEPLRLDPQTGQPVIRLVQAAGIIFKGSGFYVNDSKNASKKNLNTSAAANTTAASNGSAPNAESTATTSAPVEGNSAPKSEAAD